MSNPGGYAKSIKSRIIGRKKHLVADTPEDRSLARARLMNQRMTQPYEPPEPEKPVKLPTVPGTATLHKKGGMVKGRDYSKGKR